MPYTISLTKPEAVEIDVGQFKPDEFIQIGALEAGLARIFDAQSAVRSGSTLDSQAQQLLSAMAAFEHAPADPLAALASAYNSQLPPPVVVSTLY